MTHNSTSDAGPALQRLRLGQGSQVLPLLLRPHQQLVARSVVAGNTAGSFWTDDPSRPCLALLWDEAHHLYVAAEKAHENVVTTMKSFLHDTVVPHAREHHTDHCMISSSNAQTDDLLQEVLPKASRRERILLRLAAPAAMSQRLLPEGFHIHFIDRSLLTDDHLGHVEDVRQEVNSMWGSQEAFLQGGSGYCVVSDSQIVCWCTAEYVSPGWCGIGIATLQAYQGKGLATATAAAFVQHCLNQGIVPHWDCWADNVPSLRVAQKAGLQTVEQYDVFITGGTCGSRL